MADYLVIVESPAKANTIKKYLGTKYKVTASMGHVRDLPKSKMGVDIEHDFEPEYINVRGKGSLISSIKKDAKGSKKIYLATDPDREGEAIAWHLAYILGIDKNDVCRVTFNEITKTAVKNGISNPRKINLDLTDAQQARRVLDRIVGYKLSPILWKKVQRGLSAGRVQSVAVKLICDREEEIEKFVPEEYWNIHLIASDKKTKTKFSAKFIGKDGKKIELHTEAEVNEVLKNLEKAHYIVSEVKNGEKKKNPAPPFTTSTLQQEASRKLNFSIRKTMSVAQTLYEGVKLPDLGSTGLITYMRTDSTRISDEARAAAREVIEEKFGPDYYENRFYKSKGDIQDAHEAIRPAHIDLHPDDIKDSLTQDQYRLYNLIYKRFIASQMAAAIYNTSSVLIDANSYNFRANGQSIKFPGFISVYVESLDEEEKDEYTKIPQLDEGDEVKKEELNSKQSFTEPPARYTEASLVKVLEENFSDIVNFEFTAQMESEFDKVAEGKQNWKEIIKAFYGPFEEKVEKVENELSHVEMVGEVSDVKCEKCGRMMVVKYGRFGKFLACPGFPDCKNIKPFIVEIDEPCPKCGAKVQIRKSKKGRSFYICENNPDNGCDYISWNKPKPGEKYVEDEDAKKELGEIKKRKTTTKAAKSTKKSTTTKRKKTVKKSK